MEQTTPPDTLQQCLSDIEYIQKILTGLQRLIEAVEKQETTE